jgi:Pyruvate/2-oxoacid:ferredoxin oxidoreductase gamma subunit
MPQEGNRTTVKDTRQGKKMKSLNLLVTGAGGQGIILASDIIGETAIAAGYDVKKTDTIGMAQRAQPYAHRAAGMVAAYPRG